MEILSKFGIDKELFKFILVGIANTLFGTAIMFGMYNLLGCDYYISSACNYIFGSILSYFLNKYFTFKYKKRSFKVVIKFIINIVICYLISYGIAKPLVLLILSKFGDFDTKLVDNIAMLVGMGLFVICNYFGQKLIVFKKGEATDEKI